MRAGKVSTLLIIDSNPAYAAPTTLGFVEALKARGLQLDADLGAERDEQCDRLGRTDGARVGDVERCPGV